MISIDKFLAELGKKKIKIRVENDRLRINAPKGAVDAEIKAQLGARKQEILDFLSNRISDTQAPISSAPEGSAKLLSFPQQRLWFLDHLEGPNPAYNIPFVLRFQGNLDLDALSHAWTSIVRRHEVLRSNFQTAEGHGRVVIHPPEEPKSFPLIELDGPDAEQKAVELIRQQAHRQFDLTSGPLYHILIIRLGANHHLMAGCIHHIISDGWSNGILVRELSLFYSARLKQTQADPPALPIQYSDFAWWQKQQYDDGQLKQQMAYWRDALDGAPEVINLPTDYPRPPRQTTHGDAIPFHMEGETAAQMKTLLANTTGATPFMLLMAAFGALLKRFTHEEDVVIGFPIANRSRRELQDLIGFFVNTLAIRVNLSGDPSFEQLLSRVRKTALQALDNADLPFEKLVDTLRPQRDPSHSPIFQVMLVVQNAPSQSLSLPDVTATPVKVEEDVAKFDLTLVIEETEQAISGSWQYNTDLFKAETVARMADHFKRLLTSLLTRKDAPLSAHNPMSAEEQTLLLHTWNQTDDPIEPSCIHQLFESQVTLHPDLPAIVGADQTWTYSQLNGRANQIARRLRNMGFGPESLAGICLDRSPHMIAAVLATLKAGGGYVPMDADYPAERLALMMEDAAISLLITTADLADRLPPHQAAVLSPEDPSLDDENPQNPNYTVHPANRAYVIFTSGSTGKPKGVAGAHLGYANLSRVHQRRFKVGPDKRILQFASFSFDASVWETIMSLTTGASLCLMEAGTLGDDLRDLLLTQKITHITVPPSTLATLPEGSYPDLEVVIVAGEACPPELVGRHGAAFFNAYGPTETSICSNMAACEPGVEKPLIGSPLDNVRVFLLDPNAKPVPTGVSGELCIGGVGLARGYLNRPAHTAQHFIPNPFASNPGERLYRSGDLARHRDRGELEFLGRIDHQIKLRGFRIELGEIEARLGEHKAVSTSLVLLREDSPGAPRLVAYVTLLEQTDQEQIASQLRNHLSGALPDYMVPAAFVILDNFPTTPNGKIDRKALPAPDFAQKGSATPPRNKTERLLVEVWSEVLGLETIGVHDNFFELGGDSILSIQITARAKKVGLNLPAKAIFENQTIAQLAEVSGDAVQIQAEQGLVSGNQPLLPIHHWFFQLDSPQPAHFNQSVLLQTPADLDPDLLTQALRQLVTHHDALRLRLSHGDQAALTIAAPGDRDVSFQTVELPDGDWDTSLPTINAIQASLDIKEGPLIKAAWLQHPTLGARLLIVIHHLAVDGVSWRIFLEDLQTVYAALTQGAPVVLPAKTTSLQQWAQRVSEYAQMDQVIRQDSFWSLPQVKPLPLDFEVQNPTMGAMQRLTAKLPENHTQALLRQAPKAYRTRINDLLLTAMLKTFGQWTGASELWVNLEGHGRESLFEDMDLSRTMGWFTSLYPVYLSAPTLEDPANLIKTVKEQIRAIPENGLGYGLLRYLNQAIEPSQAPQIGFNYHGQVDRIEGGSGFSVAREATGQAIHADTPWPNLLDLGGAVVADCLELTLDYQSQAFSPDTVQHLLDQYTKNLISLIDHCLSPEAGGYTPSDFPLAHLSQTQVDRLTHELVIDDIMALSPMQQGMMFHTLYAPSSGSYCVQLHFQIDGALNPDHFREACQTIVNRHAALRLGFLWKDLKEPVQFIQTEANLPWRLEDWRDLSKDQQQVELTQLLQQDREQGFNIDQPPLLRLTVIRMDDESWRFIWSNHHLLLDGWSLPLVIGDVLTAYESIRDKAPQTQTTPPSFRDYIAWLNQQDRQKAEQWWRARLGDFREATPLPLALNRPAPVDINKRYPSIHHKLSDDLTKSLTSLARDHHLTLNTLLQGAWSLLLSHHAASSDVAFGTTLSGRPADLPGVETMVGLFINTLPMRVQIDPSESLLNWLSNIQQQTVALEPYSYTPLVDIQGWSGLPNANLFETIVIFENYPVDESISQKQSSLAISDVQSIEQTDYPITLVGSPGQQIGLQLLYDATRFNEENVRRLLDQLERIFTAMVERKDANLEQISFLDPLERRQIQQMAWWRNQLTDAPPLLELPYDYPRTAVQEMASDILTTQLESDLNNADLSNHLLSSFAALLHIYSRQDDLIIGASLSNHPVLPLRLGISKTQSHSQIIEHVSDVARNASDHGDASLEDIISGMDISQSESYAPLLQVVFAFDSNMPPSTQNLDLELSVTKQKDRLTLKWTFNTRLFRLETIAQMAAHFERLASAITAEPNQTLANFSLLSEQERLTQLNTWNNTSDPLGARCIHQLFEDWAAKYPDNTALTGFAGDWSYAKLNSHANRLAHRLIAQGLGPENLIGICLPRSPEMIIAVLATLKAGSACVSLDAKYPAERLGLMIEDANITTLITTDDLYKKLPPNSAKTLSVHDSSLIDQNEENPQTDVTPANRAYVIFTSGTTGRPKGVEVTHLGVANLSRVHQRCFKVGPGSRVLQFSSFSFDASVWELIMSLTTGASLCLMEPDTLGEDLRQFILEHRVTHFTMPPSALAALPEDTYPDLEISIVAGESCPPELPGRFGQSFVNAYGPTETTICSNLTFCEANQGKPSIGGPLDNVQVYLLDQHAQLVPAGVAAELCIGGAGLTRGYLSRPALTANVFIPNPFSDTPGARLYKTGDLARYRPNGEIEYIGRIDHQIKLRGFRIELGEIEARLAEHESIASALVLMREDRPGSPLLVAYVIPVKDATVNGTELRAHLHDRLPEYMTPNHYVAINAFPVTPNGKINRAALPAPILASSEIILPRTPTEQTLAEIWTDVLDCERVGVQDNFFQLGGHSLKATQVVSAIIAAFQIELPLKTLFETPVLEDLARIIDAKKGQSNTLPALEKRSGTEQTPLSFAQERLWFMERLNGPGSTNNMPVPMKLNGALDVTALSQALDLMGRRHESFRTNFGEKGGKPYVILHDQPQWKPLQITDLSSDTPQRQQEQIDRAISQDALEPFDIAIDPLLRFHLLKTGEHEHVLLLNMHHIISDGWSIGIFVEEMAALYLAFSKGQANPLPEPQFQYGDFANWQRTRLSDEIDRQLAYWKEKLADLSVLDLPTDRVRPAVQTYSGAHLNHQIPKAVSDQLNTLAKDQGASPFMTLLAAFKLLLARYTGQDDIVIGAPIAGRNTPGVEKMIGFFINTLVLRTSFKSESDLCFLDLLDRIKTTTLEAYDHQDIPFPKLVQELDPDRDPSRNPLFQVFFNMINLPDRSVDLPDLSMSAIGDTDIGAKFDITIYASETEQGYLFSLHYNADLFSADRMAILLDQYGSLLDQIAAQPKSSIDSYVLNDPRSAQVLPNPAAPLDDAWLGAIHQIFEGFAKREPARLAVSDPHGQWTYAELNQHANHLAHHLLRQGLNKEDIVAIYANRDASLVLTVLAILKTGATYTILDPSYPDNRLTDILDLAQPKLWIYQESAGAVPETVSNHLQDAIRIHLPIKPASFEGESANPSISINANDRAFVAFTSGSTGKPKGIEGLHGPLTHFLPWMQETFGFNSDDRFSMLSGLAHDPLQRDIFTPLCFGASIHIPAPDAIVPVSLAKWMIQTGVTATHLTPAMSQILTEGARSGSLESLKFAFITGDVLTRRDVNRIQDLAPNASAVNFYGSTETQRSVGHYIAPPSQRESGDREVMPLGHGVRDVQLLVISSRGGLAAIGEVGEIHIRSPHLARGYLHNPEQTAANFISNPITSDTSDRVYKTGDLGRYLPSGEVVFAGRVDFQIKIRGFRIEPSEIEGALARHLDVREAVVLASDDLPGGKGLVAYILAESGLPKQAASQNDPTHITAANNLLRSHLSASLPDYMLPAAYVFLETLPLTPNKKIDRRALPKPDLTTLGQQEYTAPRNQTEEALAAIWSDVLGHDKISIHDDFFALGGHSLLATRIIARITANLGVQAPIRQMFTTPTIAGFAAWIAENPSHGAPAKPILPAPGDRTSLPLSFAQERLWVLSRMVGKSSAYNMPLAIRLTGSLDPNLLAQSFQFLLQRHEILRTTYSQTGEGLFQHIGGADRFQLEQVTADSNSQETQVQQIVEHHFDLVNELPIRARLISLQPKEHILVICLHHIATDGWSMGVLTKELAGCYAALSGGESPTWPTLPIQYADYGYWQRDDLEGEILDQQLDYWKTRLANLPPLLELPTDHPEPKVKSYRGATTSLHIDQQQTEALQQLARERGVSLFVVLLSSIKLLMHKWTNQEDMVLGTVIAGRTRAELEPLIGCFMNFLALRSQPRSDLTTAEFIDQVSQTVLDAYSHQDCPFEKVVAEINPRRVSQEPLYNVAFLLQNFPQDQPFSSEISAEHISVVKDAALLDLRFVAFELPTGEIRLDCEYSADLFEPSTINLLMDAYQQLIKLFTSEAPTLGDYTLPAALVDQAESARVRNRKQTIAVTASFTAEPVEDAILFWMDETGMRSKLAFAPYQQIFQQCLDPSSLLSRNNNGVNVVLLRLEDWERFESGQNAGEQPQQKLTRLGSELVTALKTLTTRQSTPCLVVFCPPSPHIVENHEKHHLYSEIESAMLAELAGLGGLYTVNSQELQQIYPVENYHDAHAEEMGHVPYTQEMFAALGTLIARRIHAIKRPPVKVIVMDCDETIWRGVCAEEGAENVRIDATHQAFHRFMQHQKDSGMLLTLASKNQEDDVIQVFKRNPQMVLTLDDIITHRVNWLPKSGNILDMARQLDLGADSFVFLDDNPVEIAEVEANSPQVHAIQFPKEPEAIQTLLKHAWIFDHLKITDADRKRAESYRQNIARNAFQESSLSFDSFLADLDLKVELAPMKPEHLPRVAQLTTRTNQFNFTTVRRSEGEISQLVENPAYGIYTAHVSDRFGDYGLVGVLIYECCADHLRMDTLLMSCRVLGRGVEHSMLRRLGEIAVENELPRTLMPFIPTNRNQPALTFIEAAASDYKQDQDKGWVYDMPSDVAAAHQWQPQAPEETPAESKPVATSDPTQIRLFSRAMLEYCEPAHILQEIRERNRITRPQRQGYVAPRNKEEELLAQAMSELLAVDRIGVHENFFELGGHSLLATQFIARVNQSFGLSLNLQAIFEYPSIAAMADHILSVQVDGVDDDLLSQLMDEVDDLSEDEISKLLGD